MSISSSRARDEVVAALTERYLHLGHQESGRASLNGLRLALAGRVTTGGLVDALAELEKGGAVVLGTSWVTLHPSARLALMRMPALQMWTRTMGGETLDPEAVEDARNELRRLVHWALGAAQDPGTPPTLIEYAAGLAAVLATTGWQPTAFTASHWHFGTPADKLHWLASLPNGSYRDPVQLSHGLARTVAQDLEHPQPAVLEAQHGLRAVSGVPEQVKRRDARPVIRGYLSDVVPTKHVCGPDCRGH